MRIAYVYDAIARIGGVERILTDKMNYLAEVYGYEVYLITAAQGMHPFSFPLSDKVKHTDINTRFHVLYQYGYLKRLWLKWKLNRQFKRVLIRDNLVIHRRYPIHQGWKSSVVLLKTEGEISET